MEGVDGFRLEQGVRVACLLAAFNAFGAARIFLAQRRAAKYGRAFSLKRTLKLTVVSVVVWQGALGTFLWTYHRVGGWTWGSVGVSASVHPAVAFPAGFVVYVVFLIGVRGLLARTGGELSYLQSAVRANAAFLQRGALNRGIVLGVVMVANPITEELIFRGLLVHQLALVSAPVWVALMVGGVVNAVNHAYQGRVLAWFHFGFYLACAATLYSPLGLVGCFGLHFAGDTVPFLLHRRNVVKYVALRRQARRAKAAAGALNSSLLAPLPHATSRTGP